MPAGQREGFVVILLDLQAGLGNAGGVGKGKVVFCFNGNTGNHFNFTLPFAMQAQGLLSVIQRDALLIENVFWMYSL